MTLENWLTIFVAIIGTNVFEKIIERIFGKKDLITALAHDRIVYLGSKYLAKGYITQDEYTDLNNIYIPYKKRGGNCLATKIMGQVNELPLKPGGIEL